jgi:phage terminase large subunit-like protein
MTDFALTDRQRSANRLLGSHATHVMLFGGSRSGKTFLIMRAIVTRALAHVSRHVVLRFRFNHLRASILADTLPKVLELCFPGLAANCTMDKQDWFFRFENGSEIWFGGLDDKDRTEKILGQEYSSVFLNECSQIPWASRNIAMTRLAQQTPLRLKAYYDCNPPTDAHWTYRVFVKKISPDTHTPLSDPERYDAMGVNPLDNRANLPPEYFRELEAMPERLRRRFFLGEFTSQVDNALWTMEALDKNRIIDGVMPELQRIVIGVDPSGCSGAEDKRSDEVGIVVCGLGVDGKAYVVEDLSGKFSPGGEAGWGRIIATAYDRHDADMVVGEVNFGGAMVGEVVRAAGAELRKNQARMAFREAHASRGKAVRAEPIALLFDQDKAAIVGHLPRLEDQLCTFTTSGYLGDKSPDRADAMIWAMSEIFPAATRPQRPAMRHESVEGYRLHEHKYRPHG